MAVGCIGPVMRICSGPGCLRAVPDDVRFCDECKPETVAADEIRQHSHSYDAELDRLRKGQRWQRVRAIVIRRDPFCKRCELELSKLVDHIVPAREAIAQAQVSGLYPRDRYAGYYLVSNLQGLCYACHSKKTDEDKRHVGPWPDVISKEQEKPKRKWTF